ncbi:MAG: hypothetical protein JWP89_38 [Schlesneria sp.]|nr:hypothetical protein [Schlesneria sp.]
MKSWRLTVSLCTSILCISVIGCGGSPDAPQLVSGKVTVKGGGPLTKGTIRFNGTGGKKIVSGFGTLDAQGAFQISSLGVNDGIPVGEYTVTLAGTETGQDYDHPNDPVVKTIADKYGTDSTTDLKRTVKSGRNTFDFELEPPAPK